MLMNTMYYNLLISLVYCALLPLHLQAQVVKGMVVDEENKPVQYAGVVLKSERDSASCATTYSDMNGQFSLTFNDSLSSHQAFLLQCSAVGYSPKTERITNVNDSVKVVLAKQVQELAEVVVSGSWITKRPDGYVARLSNATITKGVNAGTTLAFLPGIVHEPTGYKLNGLPIDQFYINGRKASAEEVESIPGEMLKSAEVSFVDRFGVTRTGGVVNLVLKAPDQGYYGNAYLQNATRGTRYDKVSGGGILNYKVGKLELYTNLKGVYAPDDVKQDDDTDYSNGDYVHTRSEEKGWMAYFLPELNINYDITKEHRLSGVFSGDFDHTDINVKTVNSGSAKENTFEGTNTGKEKTAVAQGLLKYAFVPQSGKFNVEVSGEYLNRHYNLDKQYSSTVITGNGAEKRNKHTQIWEVVAHSSQTWNDNLSTDFSLVWNGVRENNTTDISIYNESKEDTKATIQNPFGSMGVYYEAGHLSLAGKLSYQGSFLTFRDRLQQTESTHKTSGLEPDLMLSYYFDNERKHNLSVNYTRSIEPFAYSLISTSKVWQDVYHYETGNPNINAPITNEVTLSTNINRDLVYAWVGYSVEKDPITFATFNDANAKDVTYTLPVNGEKVHWWQAGVQTSVRIKKGWVTKFNVNTTWGRQRGDFPSGKIDVWSKRWMFQWHHMVALSKGWSLYHLFYCQPTYTTYNMDFLAVYGMEGNLSKRFGDKFELNLNYSLGKQRTIQTKLANAVQTYRNRTPVPYLSLTFRWNFKGGKDVDVRRETTTQEYEEIKAKE